MLPEDQVVRYTAANGSDIAWSAVGAGPPLLMGGWWSSHLVLDWESVEFRSFVAALAENFTVIRYDPPGVGVSRAGRPMPHDIRAQRDAILAVMDAAGAPSASLLAGSSGCPVAVSFAATHPTRVRNLVLYGGYLRGAAISSPADRRAMVELIRAHWGLGSRVLADIFIPDATRAQRDAFARAQRRTASPDEAASVLSFVYQMDGSEWADQVSAPTLVVHRRDDRAIRFALGKQLADAIPKSDFIALEGISHYPWYGDTQPLLAAVQEFLGVTPSGIPTGNAPPPVVLSDREREIMSLVAQGLTDAQIAAELFLSVHTVHRHVANVRTKLGVPSRSAAAVIASRTS